jgi:hypothetical protein
LEFDKACPKLERAFAKICKVDVMNPRSKINRDQFSEYLLLRYPERMVHVMVAYFDFPEPVNYEGYVKVMEFFAANSEERQLYFIFDLLDLN